MVPNHRPACGLLQAMPLPSPHMPPPWAEQTKIDCSQAFFDLAATKPLSSNPFTRLVLRGSEPRRLLELCEKLPPPAHRRSFVHPRALPLPVPFPQMFSKEVSSKGLLSPGHTRGSDVEVEQCPVATQLHAAAQAGRCEALKLMAKIVKSRQRTSWAAAVQAQYGVDLDEFREVFDTVTEHLECAAAESSEDEDASD